jgi:hypothetical protein
MFPVDNDSQVVTTVWQRLDMLLPMYHLLDRTPLGRQETKGNSMHAGENSWIRHHDEYGVEGKPDRWASTNSAPRRGETEKRRLEGGAGGSVREISGDNAMPERAIFQHRSSFYVRKCSCSVNQNRRENFEVKNIWLH